jgi:hypothetical protein
MTMRTPMRMIREQKKIKADKENIKKDISKDVGKMGLEEIDKETLINLLDKMLERLVK